MNQQYKSIIGELGTISFGNLADFCLGIWHDFIWELGKNPFSELADFCSASWRSFTWRVGGFLLGELAKFFETQKNNSPIPPNYRTFVPNNLKSFNNEKNYLTDHGHHHHPVWLQPTAAAC